MPTEKDVAQWMYQQVMKTSYFYQEIAVVNIKRFFGNDFVYTNENGNLAISPKVLREFKKLTGDAVVWERGDKCWRKRQHYDDSTKRIQD
ncbi:MULTISPECIES: DUF6953 family protein [Providencia]|uniref:DUF6953 family protein n=1 Tax=Providencia TaxID=586 RepID=UPI0024B1993C